MKTLPAAALACLLMVAVNGWAKDRAAPIPKGTQVGVVNLLDPEVMHYHAANDSKDSFVKIQSVAWSVQDMLDAALKEQMEPLGLAVLPLAPSDSLLRSREDCFVNAALANGLPRKCTQTLAELASSAGVSNLVVMAPGLNNSDHAGGNRIDGVTEYMRGWGLLTRERAGGKDKPTLFNEIELLFVTVTPDGVSLRARQWGGVLTSQWQNYTVPADQKQIPADQLDQLQPAYAAMLSRQAKGLLEQVRVE